MIIIKSSQAPPQRDRWPCGHGCADQAMPQPVLHVGRERRGDAQAEQPPREPRHLAAH